MLRKVLILTFASLFAISCSSKNAKDSTIDLNSVDTSDNKVVYFEFDSYEITDSAESVLDQKVVKWLKSSPSTKVIIEGHCDERGTTAYNKVLGQNRADAVKDYLIDNGIDSSRIRTVSYGKSKPVVKGHDEESWAKNRRAVTISISR